VVRLYPAGLVGLLSTAGARVGLLRRPAG
jgi:hypothetical protein